MVAYFTNDFQLINIEKTAIIIALGVDKAKNQELEVTVQIAVPQASNQTSTNSDAILSAKDKTLYGALEKISLETGWYPKLTFCNLIVFGQDLIKDNFMPILEYILTSNRFQNSAVVAVAEEKAKDLLNSTTPLDYISSFALQKILLRNLDRTSSVCVLDVRKLCALSRSRSDFCYMPLVKNKKTDDKSQGDSQNSGGQSQNSQSSSNSDNNQINFLASGDGSGSSGSGGLPSAGGASNDKPSVFDASSTLLFSNGKFVSTLTKDQTHCFNMITQKVKETFIPITFERENKQIDALISIVSNRYKVKISIENGIPKLEVNLTLICEKEETYANENLYELAKFNKVSQQAITALEKKMTKDIQSLLDISKENNCDFLQIKELIYRKSPKEYYALKDNLFELLDYTVNVTCKNYR